MMTEKNTIDLMAGKMGKEQDVMERTGCDGGEMLCLGQVCRFCTGCSRSFCLYSMGCVLRAFK